MGIFTKTLAAFVATATLAGSANANCWSDAAYKAAQLREFDTMMMVEALRCRKTAANFVHDYNKFVVASRPALLKANAHLRGHFEKSHGVKGALNAYDNYMTTVANRYGAGTEGLNCTDMASVVQAALATDGSPEALHQVVAAANMVPTVASARCAPGAASTVSIAARR
jgi:hypothetical protein